MKEETYKITIEDDNFRQVSYIRKKMAKNKDTETISNTTYTNFNYE